MNSPTVADAGWISSTDHYENFPVASVLVPATLRPAIAAAYGFARHGDDVADEGDAPVEARLAELAAMRSALLEGRHHERVEPLRAPMSRHRIPVSCLLDLLSAFEQDARGARFPDRAALMAYCRHSADPVGRIVLRIFDADHGADLAASDAICSALQLINFVQDVGQDHARGRCYLPEDETARAGLAPHELAGCVAAGRCSPALRRLLDHQLDEARRLLDTAPRLIRGPLPWRLRLELAAIVAAGGTMLERLRHEDPLAARRKLGRADAPAIALAGLRLLLRRSVR
ncbi:MAG: squalene synthase HpnC [Burkholderiaceae bacterium]